MRKSELKRKKIHSGQLIQVSLTGQLIRRSNFVLSVASRWACHAMAAPPRALGGCGTLAGSTAHRSRSTQYHSPGEQPAVASGFVKPHHRQLRLRRRREPSFADVAAAAAAARPTLARYAVTARRLHGGRLWCAATTTAR